MKSKAPKADTKKRKRGASSRSLERVVSFSELRYDCMRHIDGHKYLTDFVKPLAKTIVQNHFRSMTEAIGLLELAVLRERQHGKANVVLSDGGREAKPKE